MSFFKKIKEKLYKTRDNIALKIETIVNSFTKIDEEFFQELEEIQGIDIDSDSPIWPVKQMVMYYLISMYSNNVYYYYKVKPLLGQLKDGREQYEKWIAEMASNF